jgi:hypothetical protein
VARSLRVRPTLRGVLYWLALAAPGSQRLVRAYNARQGR